jgi:hypothetical protein
MQFPVYREVKNIADFGWSIIDAARSYHDIMQSQLPSYRERIVQIRLDSDEGGLHLKMSQEMIKKIIDIGQRAGEKLCDPQQFSFEQHRWVRFRVLMAQLEHNLEDIEDVLNSYQALLDKVPQSDPKFPYYRDEVWCRKAVQRIISLKKMVQCWQQADQPGSSLFSHDVPLPKPVLRVTPEL